MKKHASAVWQGGIKDGKGTISTETGVLSNAPYGFKSRFEDGPGTNPEELIGAAHAGCFSMALSAVLGKEGFVADSIETRAEATMEPGMDPGPTITGVTLIVKARVPGIDAERFQQIAGAAKAGCVISRALSVPVGLQATLDA